EASPEWLGRGGPRAMQIGLVNWTGGYLTGECYGDGVSVLGNSLGKKQVREVEAAAWAGSPFPLWDA
uniref:Uncharacterized protein n=1 Tax=Varanus komodoensis TaxID=61221 RepID=A0A8D2LVX5_VARKO